VSAFNSEACPTGWQKFTQAQGRFVIGFNDGGFLRATRGAAYGDVGEAFHKHRWSYFLSGPNTWNTWDDTGSGFVATDWSDGIGNEGDGYYPFSAFPETGHTYYNTSRGGHTPPYVQLLYCEKA